MCKGNAMSDTEAHIPSNVLSINCLHGCLAYKRSTVICLSLRMEGWQCLVEVLYKGTVTHVEILLDCPIYLPLSSPFPKVCIGYYYDCVSFWICVYIIYHFSFPHLCRSYLSEWEADLVPGFVWRVGGWILSLVHWHRRAVVKVDLPEVPRSAVRGPKVLSTYHHLSAVRLELISAWWIKHQTRKAVQQRHSGTIFSNLFVPSESSSNRYLHVRCDRLQSLCTCRFVPPGLHISFGIFFRLFTLLKDNAMTQEQVPSHLWYGTTDSNVRNFSNVILWACTHKKRRISSDRCQTWYTSRYSQCRPVMCYEFHHCNSPTSSSNLSPTTLRLVTELRYACKIDHAHSNTNSLPFLVFAIYTARYKDHIRS